MSIVSCPLSAHPPGGYPEKPQCPGTWLGFHFIGISDSSIGHVVELNVQPLPLPGSQEASWYHMAQSRTPPVTQPVFLGDHPESPHRRKFGCGWETRHEQQRHSCNSGNSKDFEANSQEAGTKTKQLLYYTTVADNTSLSVQNSQDRPPRKSRCYMDFPLKENKWIAGKIILG